MESLGEQYQKPLDGISSQENLKTRISDKTEFFEKGRERFQHMQEWRGAHPYPTGDPDAIEEWHEQKKAFEGSLKISDEPEFSCYTCRDMGWVKVRGGDVTPCPDCAEFDSNKAALRYTGLPEPFHAKTFDSFSCADAPLMQDALKSAMMFVDGHWPWLVLAGNRGCGKTHLACAISNSMASKGWKVRFWVVADLLDRIRGTFSHGYSGEQAQQAQGAIDAMVYEPEVLILDDLGVERRTEWVDEELFKIIDRRYREGRLLVITTNAPIEKLSERLTSRFGDKEMCHVVYCKSPDYRPKLRGKRKSRDHETILSR